MQISFVSYLIKHTQDHYITPCIKALSHGKQKLKSSSWHVWTSRKQLANWGRQINLISVLANFSLLANANLKKKKAYLTCERRSNETRVETNQMSHSFHVTFLHLWWTGHIDRPGEMLLLMFVYCFWICSVTGSKGRENKFGPCANIFWTTGRSNLSSKLCNDRNVSAKREISSKSRTLSHLSNFPPPSVSFSPIKKT